MYAGRLQRYHSASFPIKGFDHRFFRGCVSPLAAAPFICPAPPKPTLLFFPPLESSPFSVHNGSFFENKTEMIEQIVIPLILVAGLVGAAMLTTWINNYTFGENQKRKQGAKERIDARQKARADSAHKDKERSDEQR